MRQDWSETAPPGELPPAPGEHHRLAAAGRQVDLAAGEPILEARRVALCPRAALGGGEAPFLMLLWSRSWSAGRGRGGRAAPARAGRLRGDADTLEARPVEAARLEAACLAVSAACQDGLAASRVPLVPFAALEAALRGALAGRGRPLRMAEQACGARLGGPQARLPAPGAPGAWPHSADPAPTLDLVVDEVAPSLGVAALRAANGPTGCGLFGPGARVILAVQSAGNMSLADAPVVVGLVPPEGVASGAGPPPRQLHVVGASHCPEASLDVPLAPVGGPAARVLATRRPERPGASFYVSGGQRRLLMGPGSRGHPRLRVPCDAPPGLAVICLETDLVSPQLDEPRRMAMLAGAPLRVGNDIRLSAHRRLVRVARLVDRDFNDVQSGVAHGAPEATIIHVWATQGELQEPRALAARRSCATRPAAVSLELLPGEPGGPQRHRAHAYGPLGDVSGCGTAGARVGGADIRPGRGTWRLGARHGVGHGPAGHLARRGAPAERPVGRLPDGQPAGARLTVVPRSIGLSGARRWLLVVTASGGDVAPDPAPHGDMPPHRVTLGAWDAERLSGRHALHCATASMPPPQVARAEAHLSSGSRAFGDIRYASVMGSLLRLVDGRILSVGQEFDLPAGAGTLRARMSQMLDARLRPLLSGVLSMRRRVAFLYLSVPQWEFRLLGVPATVLLRLPPLAYGIRLPVYAERVPRTLGRDDIQVPGRTVRLLRAHLLQGHSPVFLNGHWQMTPHCDPAFGLPDDHLLLGSDMRPTPDNTLILEAAQPPELLAVACLLKADQGLGQGRRLDPGQLEAQLYQGLPEGNVLQKHQCNSRLFLARQGRMCTLSRGWCAFAGASMRMSARPPRGSRSCTMRGRRIAGGGPHARGSGPRPMSISPGLVRDLRAAFMDGSVALLERRAAGAGYWAVLVPELLLDADGMAMPCGMLRPGRTRLCVRIPRARSRLRR
ncbi:hypothetical protein H696_05767 [Fonticula alba]|uniref:Uncharacterized protein n=1 Tax=Fonticula alba TaxID=691883 RepID=A0A058Z2R0_FONAL|nr:hypothetical protein H696_05767 [Fonticula alba]KCV67812.1 hypothetical protein H696_05767 [Fonticula alba]|eukprot:XP_009497843.1 hypothetical protein H696_05767 [Fonticula alba]